MMAKVRIQPDNVLSGWLPILSDWTGAGWGLVCPPDVDDQVLVIPQEGHAQHGIIVGRAFSERKRPPRAAVGEFWLVHKSGSAIKLMNDGKIRMSGDLHVDGDIYDRRGSLQSVRQVYNGHHHRVYNGTMSATPDSEL
jgi:phage baseplate assembly protein V